MGCSAVKNEDKNTSKELNEKDEKDNIKKEMAVKAIQTSFRRHQANKIKIESENLYRNKFISQIEKDPNMVLYSEETFNNSIPPEVSKDTNYYKQNRIFFEAESSAKESTKNFNNNNQSNIILNMPPIGYIREKETYKGSFKYNSENDTFIKYGKGYILKNSNLIECEDTQSLIDNNDYFKGKIFYKNGDIFTGSISKDYQIHNGTLFLKKDDNYKRKIISEDFSLNHTIIDLYYENGDIYSGEASKLTESTGRINYIPEGKGKLTINQNKSVYEGDFKKGKFNGYGTLFIPDEQEEQSEDGEIKIGKFISTNWLNGQENGKGKIKLQKENQTEIINCKFRYGKLIHSSKQVVNKKITLHKRIFEFLNPLDIYIVSKGIKTKTLKEFVFENDNLEKVQLAKILYYSNLDIDNKKEVKINFDIIESKISNVPKLLNNFHHKVLTFLPIVAYKTNGGIAEERFRYGNIFDPNITKTYTSHYLLKRNCDVEIFGVLNRKMFECVDNILKKEETNKGKLNALIRKKSTINSEIVVSNIKDTLMKKTEEYSNHYTKFENEYPPLEKFKAEIDDSKYILEEGKIGNINQIFFTLNFLIINIPKRYDFYSMINSPCNFLSVYLYDNKSNEEEEKAKIDFDEKSISQYNYDIKKIYNSIFNEECLSFQENEDCSYIEFDSAKQKGKKLICLIELKEYKGREFPFYIKLHKFYHTGRFIVIKLINQNLLYGVKNKTSIDIGTVNCFGEVFYLK